tara:strand:+ start:1512 stop:1856 length:345 start_codon:yes stop_codon:yes gene_type:complete
MYKKRCFEGLNSKHLDTKGEIMHGYVIVNLNVLDSEKMADYSAVAGPSIKKFGGEVLFKGKAETLSGNSEYDMLVIVKFESVDKAKEWYNSNDYQAIIPTREMAMEAIFTVTAG